MNVTARQITEHPGSHRLGRHVFHDARSHAFAYEGAGPIRSVQWERHCAPFDQGALGSCTGNALAGALMTGPLYVPGRDLTEDDAVRIYSEASHFDGITGVYPPNDTGSSGLAVCKAARKDGLISAYHHAFSLQSALRALSAGPVITGIAWWSGFDSPQGNKAELVKSGFVRGGHELVVDGIDVENGYIHGTNSWGSGWGNAGGWVMSFGTWQTLLKDQGDVTVPVR